MPFPSALKDNFPPTHQGAFSSTASSQTTWAPSLCHPHPQLFPSLSISPSLSSISFSFSSIILRYRDRSSLEDRMSSSNKGGACAGASGFASLLPATASHALPTTAGVWAGATVAAATTAAAPPSPGGDAFAHS
eukprot:CAMPEP_0183292884 /NCGR_PEP_ID=MMETSP0160_2-20130417/1781_1 /TAXON_ID=2839 ORGANISM="Odontella Sinensis, Strain Grunow 1884" /NCGR_SAMPLE_ID=MMETSP0160_2 /ASSEMBLY_ACC=CAM_ASM_000250 /LENGTH=133 /DNA_ID=CAMNT_0025453909 /DNA_START=245 /DNA_END=643 /DNA_ORIENTATION=-